MGEKPDTGMEPGGGRKLEPVSGGGATGPDVSVDAPDAGMEPGGGWKLEPASGACQERMAGMEN